MQRFFLYFLVFFGLLFSSCDDDNDNPDINNSINIPSTFSFERNGVSTVDYSGQTARLDMLAAMKTYLLEADGGKQIEAAKLNDMFENANDVFASAELNKSG